MKFTREERKRIYQDAAQLVADADYSSIFTYADEIKLNMYARFACHAIAQSCDINFDSVVNEFPEIYAFKSESYPGGKWLSEHVEGEEFLLPESDEGNELRQLTLIFAAELCGDEDFLK
jgi:hypothetical protein